ncbi:MAG: hypothetical protein IPH35_14715 [Rhodoferax sp.]|nr:hypothetical protein [Rhodoferax sp.]
MTPTVFATFRYQHADRPALGVQRLWFIRICLVLALALLAAEYLLTLVLLAPEYHITGIVLALVAALAWLSAPRTRTLQLGPRYLLCGQQIIYYGNVKGVVLSRAKGALRVQANNGQVLVLERDKFPTNARKADKIERNKADKFDKVAEKIIDKVRQTAPHAKVTEL